MKTITMTLNEQGAINLTLDGFENDFEVNGLLQTVLMHRVMNQFGLPSGLVAGDLPQAIETNEEPSVAVAEGEV